MCQLTQEELADRCELTKGYISQIENDLTSAKTIFNSMTSKSKSKAFDYEEQVVNIEGIIGRNINDGIKLDKYIAYEKQAKKIVSQQQNKKSA